jgi:CubicO group peptidase (beta-lactamase class C family)
MIGLKVSTMNRAVGLGVATAALLVTASPRSAQEAPWPTTGWAESTPAEQGLDAEPLNTLAAAIDSGRYGLVDRLVVVRNGYVVMNRRWDNAYRELSRGLRGPLGCGWESCDSALTEQEWAFNYLHPDYHPYYQGRDVHSLQSVTKSVTVTLVGIALRRGEIAGLDVPLLSFFEDYDLSRVGPALHGATLEDLLTMRSGIEWHEQDRPLDETNTTLQLEHSEDWIQFTLNQPMDAEPGEKWAYSSGGSHLMSGVIRQATGMFATAYAERYLFGPLGINDYHWKTTPRGYPDTEGGLYLEAEQLAKIGYLYLNDGVWDGRRLLPDGWAEAATGLQVTNVNQFGWGYGYQWWRLDRAGEEVWAGLGFGGQFLIVMPQYDLIGVANSWNLFGRSQISVLNGLIMAMIQSAN